MPRRFIHRHQAPHRPSDWTKAALGALLGLTVVVALGEWSETQMLVAPLGASAVLLFGLPDSPLSQPANLIGGHFIATLLALALDALLPQSGWSIALAVGLVIGLLGALRLTHPPAGADPIVVMMIHRLPPRSVYPLPVRASVGEP